ncbi:hypothetical protein HanXRQr2_Chr11g0482951 [Helianthus annuus]|uniref:Uncharacterized protein n=1 Tax=Helianthus annuus TaxID=4232 RepID=A0A9K3MZF8_HELAN|nr:hypothetical protein HanXRQr2_Chr11g0482951 [Helianthus annuus]
MIASLSKALLMLSVLLSSVFRQMIRVIIITAKTRRRQPLFWKICNTIRFTSRYGVVMLIRFWILRKTIRTKRMLWLLFSLGSTDFGEVYSIPTFRLFIKLHIDFYTTLTFIFML